MGRYDASLKVIHCFRRVASLHLILTGSKNISTEDPNLHMGRTLIPMRGGGQSVPLGTIPESYEESMKSLPGARKHPDDLLVYDDTPDGKGHRLVARFISGELVRVTHSSPDWLKRVFSHELCGKA